MILGYFILLAIAAPVCAIDHLPTLKTIEPYQSVELTIASNTAYNRNDSASATSNILTAAKPVEQLSPALELPNAKNGNTACFIGNFTQGFGYNDNGVENGFSSIPPDPSGAAGAERLVAVVNVMIEVRTKAGVLTFRDGFKDFFAGLGTSQAGSRIFDPKVIYDEHANRFVVIALQSDFISSSRFLLAVSKSEFPDSISGWYMFSIDSAETISTVNSWADYPGFEVDEEAVYITANMFSFSDRTFQGVRLWIVDKGVNGGFYGGGPPTFFGSYNPYVNVGIASTTMPAQVHGSGGAGSSIGTFLVSNLLYSDGSVDVQIFTVQNPLGVATFVFNQLNLGQISQDNFVIPDSPQLGSTVLISTNDERVLDAVWRSNKLWMTFIINPRTPDIDSNQATAHWVRIDTSTLTVEAQGNLGGESFSAQTNTAFPAVALNSQGQVAFGYAASSSTMYAGAHGSIFVGTVEYPFTVQAGLDYYVRDFGGTRNRWGDYTGISVDPTDGSFWIFNQFANARGSVDVSGQDGRWGTAWARVYCTTVVCLIGAWCYDF